MRDSDWNERLAEGMESHEFVQNPGLPKSPFCRHRPPGGPYCWVRADNPIHAGGSPAAPEKT